MIYDSGGEHLMKKIKVTAAVLIAVLIGGISVSAAPSDSFFRIYEPDGTATSVISREMFTASDVITATSLGIEKSMTGLTDVCFSDNGDIYILCGGDSRIIVLNPDYSFKKELKLEYNGEALDFTVAGVIYADKSLIYIADTKNSRVLISNTDGKTVKILGRPDSEYIPEDFLYQPVSIALDEKGYAYILSLGSFYGALVYSPDGNFMGFYGANQVNASAMDTLKFIWNRITKNDAKKSASLKTMPYSFVDLAIDRDGYMVTCTGKTKENITVGQIRKLSPNGQDILYRRNPDGSSSVSSSVNFMESERNRRYGYQNMISVTIDDEGFIYALDSEYGLIYVYDGETELLSTFGGGIKSGIQKGVFKNPVSIATDNGNIIVADEGNSSITVFKLTDFGLLLMKAVTMNSAGDYLKAKQLWQNVLESDRGNQAAYRGLAMASLYEGNNIAAMEYAKKGLDYNAYDMALGAILKDFLADNFIWITILFLLLIALTIYVVMRLKKKRAVTVSPKLQTVISVPLHPFRSFDDLKYKKYGSITYAVIITGLLYLAFTLGNTVSGFLYNRTNIKQYNMLFTLLQTIGLIFLWSVSNWLISSLFSGKGTLKEVFCATAYCLTPLIVFLFLRLGLSYILPLSAMNVLNEIQVLLVGYCGFLLVIAMMKIHEYDFFKFLATLLAVVFLMIMIVFVLFLFVTLFKQVIGFVSSFYEEISYR